MKNNTTFIHDNFLLESKYAEELYHNHAAKMPIIDYHNHLPPNEIAENKIYRSITEIWINGDHYKWRAMRTLGIDRNGPIPSPILCATLYITGPIWNWIGILGLMGC